jgi:GDPmannose 4,6-dehydratase
MLSVNVSSLHVLLEHARVRSRDMRLLYAGSSKCFGDPLPRTIDDETPRVASCLYGISKNTGAALVEYYRRKHDIAAGVLYLFNHESVLRPPEFFIPKVAQAIALARRGSSVKAAFQSLDFSCDWGCADEYMKIAMDLIATLPGQDFVVATGESRNARELVATAFARFGLDAWDHVTAPRGVERPAYEVRPERLRRGLGRVPTCRIDDVLVEMVDAYGDGSGKLEPHDLHRH